MSQHDMDIANASGSAVRADINLALLALVSQNSGGTAPSTTFAYQWWADTTAGILKQRNAANSAWVSILNLATGVPTGAAASGANADITSLTALASVPTIVSSNVVNLTGDQTVAGIKTFSSQPNFPAQSMVRLSGYTGFGSTNTCIGRLTTTVLNQGSDITYADSATLGALFTINTNGVYAITFTGGGNVNMGVSLNSSQLSTGINTITVADRLCSGGAGASLAICAAWTGYLPSGSLVRPHTDGSAFSSITPTFTITRVA